MMIFKRPSRRFLSDVAMERIDPRRLDYCSNEAKAFVVFGSFACGCFGPDSDLDIFVVGSPDTRIKTPLLDIVVVGNQHFLSQNFLQSELARHIWEYGHWFRGDRTSVSDASIGEMACSTKRLRIHKHLDALASGFGRWSAYYISRYVELICLDVHRLSMMIEGCAPAPRQMLMANALETEFSIMDHFVESLGGQHEIAGVLTASYTEVCLGAQWRAELARDVAWRRQFDIQ